MRRKILIALGVVVGITLLAVTVGVLYIFFGDLSGHRGTVERLVSDALGRELKIAGEFKPDVGFTSHVEAGQITLANPDGSSEPYMVSVDRLAGDIKLLPILRGSYQIDNLEIEGAHVLLESDDTGRANWQFDTGEAAETDGGEAVDIVIGQALLQAGTLVVNVPSLERRIELTVAELEFESDDAEVLDLSIEGTLNEAALGLSGRLGTLAGLLAAGAVETDLEGTLGSVQFATRGQVGNLATFAAADLEIHIDGAEMSEVTDLLGLPSLGEGPFRVAAAAEPAPQGFSVTLDGTFGQVTAAASGVTDALFDPNILDLEVRASGPDVSAIAALAGIEDASANPFSVSGHVLWKGFPITLEDVVATVGDNRIALDGTVGAPPRLMGTDFRFDAEGPDISALSLLAGLGLPADSFQVRGRLVRLEHGIAIEGVEATVGPTVARVSGTLGDPPEYAGTDLQIEANGPNLATFSAVAGMELPALPFKCTARLAPEGDTISLEGVEARLGSNTARIEGTVSAAAGFLGTDVRLVAEGPDLSWLEGPTGFTDLPKKPYRVEGGLVVEDAGYRLKGMNARVGEVTARIDGLIGSFPDLVGTNATFLAEGPDFSIPASLVGAPGVPPEPFRIDGALRMKDGGFELEGVQAIVGEAQATVAGRIQPAPDLVGTRLSVNARGPDASIFGPLLRQPALPSAPFSVSGMVEIGEAGYRLDSVVVELAGNRVAIDGTLVPSGAFAGTDLELDLAGPDLADVGRLVSQTGVLELADLPREPFSLTGGVTIDNAGHSLRSVQGSLGSAVGRVNGRLGPPPGFQGSDLTVHLDGPNASLFTAITGVTVPVAPFQVDGRVERQEDGYRFHNLTVRIGEYHAQAHGRLGELPKLVGTDFEVRAEGPSLLLFSQLAGIPDLPDRQFEIAGTFDGNPTRFKSDRFTARIGTSDLTGSFRVDLEDKPKIQAELTSEVVNIEQFFQERAARKTEQRAEPEEAASPPRQKGDLVISDRPFELGILHKVDADLVWSIGEFVLPLDRFSDIEIDVTLQDGRLRGGPLEITGSGGGSLGVDFILEPAGTDYTLRSKLLVDDVRLRLSQNDEYATHRPTIDVDLEFGGTGRSPHEIASSANGSVQLVASEGAIDKSIVNLVAADILVALLNAFNPFSEEQPVTQLECAVMVFNIENGIGILDPMAVQTDVMTIVGGGEIDFSTEKLSLDWVTKPRKGLGISASMFTNPYIRLGGTLGNPNLAMKPLEAMTSTGLAVATGGLSILGKGMLDRITAEQKVCEQALKKVEKRRRKAAANAESTN